MAISAFALIFLTIYVGLAQLDALSLKIGLFSPVFGGAVTGLVMGDLKTGLIVGATLQLATLGVATYGVTIFMVLSRGQFRGCYRFLSACSLALRWLRRSTLGFRRG